MNAETSHGARVVLLRTIVAILVIMAGLGAFAFFSHMKEPLALSKMEERAMPVEVTRVVPEEVPVTIKGYGEVRALNEVQISAEVRGKIVEIHPRLDEGEVIPKGELLFRIDPVDYSATREQAAAQVEQLTATVSRLEKQYQIDQGRLETAKRTAELAQQEFERTKALFEKDEVGTRSGVDQAEMRWNQQHDIAEQLGQGVTVYPLQISEARKGIEAARAQLEMAQASLDRTTIRAPFTGRLKLVHLEPGQYVTPGVPVLTIADDSVLEIAVPLDSRDVRQWLKFQDTPAKADPAWFGDLAQVQCRITWTEAPGEQYWTGILDRVERFDQQTRTVTVAVRVSGENTVSSEKQFPLVDGMFCEVEIPGSTMENVYRLPRWAVTYENQVFVAENDRLQMRDVEVARSQGEETFVKSGLQPGDIVITTRLVDPLPNSKIAYSLDQRGAADQ